MQKLTVINGGNSGVNSEALLESRTLRDKYADHLDILDKVKKLSILPDDIHVTVEMAANYYEVDKNTIEVLISRNSDEFRSDGMIVLYGDELKEAKRGYLQHVSNLKYAPKVALLPRRAVLRIGMLLRDSEVAKTVRNYLLNIEKQASPVQRQQAMEAEINRFKEAFFTPDNLRKLAVTLEENETLKTENHLLIEEVKVLTPKANRFDSFLDSKTSHKIGVMANTFGIPNMGQNNMFQYLRDKKILFKKNGLNQPYRKYLEAGLFEVIWRPINDGEREVAITLVTPKGINYIFGELVKDGYIDEYGYIPKPPIHQEGEPVWQ